MRHTIFNVNELEQRRHPYRNCKSLPKTPLMRNHRMLEIETVQIELRSET